jgi:UDP-N-acetylglucosamine 2-epimerase (non-hydrolysing)
MIDPNNSPDMLNAVEGAEFVLTDSVGLQEETTELDRPCVTILKNTEFPARWRSIRII